MSSKIPGDANPYRSPRIGAELLSAGVVASDPAAPLKVALVKSSMLYRRVQLAGRFNASIEWNARWPYESVRVNGFKVVSQHAVLYIPRFTFQMYSAEALHQVAVDVWVSWAYFTKAFRITIDGETVYSEGKCSHFADRESGAADSPQ